MKQLQQVEIARMRQLADLLLTVPPSQFDLKQWRAMPETPAKTLLFRLIEIAPACGFAGCAMGWAAHAKLFDGLYIDDEGSLVYNGFEQYRAAAAEYLFSPALYRQGKNEPGDVAYRLNRFANKVENRLKRAYAQPLKLAA